MRLLLLLWLFSTLSSSTASILFTKHSEAEQKSPYLADYSRIDWELCKGGGSSKTYCLQSDRCSRPLDFPTRLTQYTGSDDPSNKICNTGIQIKPISDTRWVFFVQIFLPDVDPTEGVVLFVAESKSSLAPKRFDLSKCHLNEKGEPTLKSDFDQPAYRDTKIIPRHLSFTDLGFICVFEINHVATAIEKTLQVALRKIVGGSMYWKLYVEVKKLSEPPKTLTLDTTEFKNIVDATAADAKSTAMLLNTKMLAISEDTSFTRNFTFTEAIKDFPTFACESPHAMLVFANGESLYEAQVDFGGPHTNEYTLFHAQDKSFAQPIADAREISCIERTCLSCAPLPFIGDCEGCTPPTHTRPLYHKDCPTIRCPGDVWIFENKKGQLFTRKDDVTCRKSDRGVAGWYRSNGMLVTKAACAPRLSCSVVSPLKDVCGASGGNHCIKLTMSNSTASCKQKKRVHIEQKMKRTRNGKKTSTKNKKRKMKHVKKEKKEEVEEETEVAVLQYRVDNQSQWIVFNSSLHCDYSSGVWYSGRETQEEFDHAYEVRCEVLDRPPFTFDDNVILYSSLSVFLGFSLFTGTFVIIGCCIRNWRHKWAERRLTENIKKRHKMKEQPEFDDLTVVKDLNAMDETTFWRLLAEFPLYSIHERITFVEHMLVDLGVRVDIEHFLSFFNHCVEMESDPRVWRKLLFGYKIILIAFNQVNRSRIGIKLNEHLKRCGVRLLRKIGFERIQGEDETLVETRNLAFNIALITNDKDTMTLLLEEGEVTRGREDIKRRRQLFAYRVRGMNAQLETMKDWDKILAVIKEPKPKTDDERYEDETPKQKRKRLLKKKDRDHAAMIRKLKGDVEANVREEKPKNRAEKELRMERDWTLKKYGGWREHMIYALCCGKSPEVVNIVLSNIVCGPFTKREILAGFRAAVEDCFDMRFTAKEVYLRLHKSLKEKVPVDTPEYAEIFEMFMRYATLDFFAEENWLVKFANTTGSFDTLEKKELPLPVLTELVDNSKLLMKQCLSYIPKMGKPHFDDSSDEEEGEGAPLGPISNRLEPDHPLNLRFDAPPSLKPDPTTTSQNPDPGANQNQGPSSPRSGPKSGPATPSEPKQGSGKSSNSGPNGSVPESKPDSGTK